MGAIVAAGMAPLGLMVLLWGGHLSPDSPLRSVYLGAGVAFDPHALSLYLAIPTIYLAPLVALVIARMKPSWMALGLGAVGALVVMRWPVAASLPQLQEGITTVGFVHRALSSVMPAPAILVCFWMCAAVWLVALGDRAWNVPPRRTVWDWFPLTATLSFMAVMPLSYMSWEKYALPLFIAAALLLLTPRGVRARPQQA